MATATKFLTTYLEPLVECLTLLQAQKILAVKPTDLLVDRVHLLAEKAEADTLTEPERAEYEYYVEVDEVVSLLKAKARHLLAA